MTDIDSLSGRELDEAVCRILEPIGPQEKSLAALDAEYENKNISTWEKLSPCGHWKLYADWSEPWEYKPQWQPAVEWHRNIGAAFELLLTIDVDKCGWGIAYTSDGFEVYSELDGAPVATGSTSEAAAVMCRAFLKLKQGE